MSSSDTSLPSSDNRAPAAGNSATPPAPETGALLDRSPKVVSVMHPVGITPYAAEGLDLGKPLFARVTYRPHRG